MTMQPRISNPAQDVIELGKYLRGLPRVDGPTYKILSEHLDVGSSSPEYLDISSAALAKLAQLRKLAEEAPDMPQAEVVEVVQAVTRMEGLFIAANQAGAWRNAVDTCVTPDDAYVLAAFGGLAQTLSPTRRITDSERTQVIGLIDEALKGLDLDKSRSWTVAPLREGLRRLRLTLKHLPFFGHDAVIEQIFSLAMKAEVAASTAKPPKHLSAVLQAVIGAVQIVLLPATVIDGVTIYQDAYLQQVQPRLEAAHKVLRLESPEALQKRVAAQQTATPLNVAPRKRANRPALPKQ